MSTSRSIAGLMGPALAALGVSLLINRDFPSVIGAELAHSQALIVLSGVLLLVAGIAIVRIHNIWSGWPTVVTVLGWLSVVSGLARIWFPQLAAPLFETFGAGGTMVSVAGAALLALGAFLTWKAYGP